jgi:hypothetical protein
MTKRHHATNYHRCAKCGQPLVKERTICVRCELKLAAQVAASQALVCSQCGGDPECLPDCPSNGAALPVPTEPEVFRP